tara:strand:- start:23123 stop:23308 length:186 start_codon:yes stop_codon:yes gene_type:complete
MKSYLDYIEEKNHVKLAKELPESDAPTNAVGSGEIAGGGYNGIDDIKVSRKARKKYKNKQS